MAQYCNINDNPLKVYPKIPAAWNTGKGMNINFKDEDPEVWYEAGFRAIEYPVVDEAIEKRGTQLIFDEDNDIGTYHIIPLTEQEIAKKKVDAEVARQVLRETRGKEEFRLMTAELRASIGDSFELGVYNALEITLEPLGDIVQQGKWTKAYNWLVDLGSDLIGQDLYDALLLRLHDGIIDLYDEHDYPWEA